MPPSTRSRRLTPAEPPPLTQQERDRIRRGLADYDKGSLIRIGLRLGHGPTSQLTDKPREHLEDIIFRSCIHPSSMRQTLDGLAPVHWQLLDIAAGERGVVEEAELLRAAMQAVPPRTTDRFDGVRLDFHERRERALPVLIELYSRGLIWPLPRPDHSGVPAPPASSSGRQAGREGPPKRSLVGGFRTVSESFAWLHPFVRFWLSQEPAFSPKPASNWDTSSIWDAERGLIEGTPGAQMLARALQALIQASQAPTLRLGRQGRPPKGFVQVLLQALQGPDVGQKADGVRRIWLEDRGPIAWGSGVGGFAAFVVAIGVGMGLVANSGRAFQAQADAGQRLEEFLREDGGRELVRRATAAWLGSEMFNELALIPELVVCGCPPYDEPRPFLPAPYQRHDAQILQKADMGERPQQAALRARRTVVEHLRRLAAGRWISFEELSESLRHGSPALLFEPEKQDVRALLDTYYGIYERTPDGRALALAPGVRWRMVEERLLARMVLGPLLALGLVQVRWDRESDAPEQLRVTDALQAAVL